MLGPVSSLVGHVLHVLGVCSSTKVLRVTARRIVAGVDYLKTTWDRTTRHFIGNSVCALKFPLTATELHHPVSCIVPETVELDAVAAPNQERSHLTVETLLSRGGGGALQLVSNDPLRDAPALDVRHLTASTRAQFLRWSFPSAVSCDKPEVVALLQASVSPVASRDSGNLAASTRAEHKQFYHLPDAA